MNDSIHKQYWNDRFIFWHFWKAIFNCFINFTFSLFSISFLRTPRCLTTNWRRRTFLWHPVWPVRAPPWSRRRQRRQSCWTSPSCSSRSSWVRWALCEPCVSPVWPLTSSETSPPGAGPLPGVAAAVSGRVCPGLAGLSPGLSPPLDCAVCLVTSR